MHQSINFNLKLRHPVYHKAHWFLRDETEIKVYGDSLTAN